MSLISILAKGFSGLGIASTVPLSFAFHNETFTLKPWTRVVPPPVQAKQISQPSKPMDEMAEIVRQHSKDQEVIVGCFETQGAQKPLWTQPLYVCINLSAEKPVAFWFYYNWKSPVSQRVKQITSIIKKRTGFSTLHFSGGSTDIADRLRPWAGNSFKPSQSCQITKQGDSYELTCGKQQPPHKSFSQTIKNSDFHRPNTLSLG